MSTEPTTTSPVNPLRKDFKTLIYPSDLGREIWFPEAIKFTILKREGTSIQGAIDAGLAAAEAEINPKGNDKGIIENLQDTAASVAKVLVSGIKGVAQSRKKEEQKPIGSIYMFMPDALTFTDTADWNGEAMGAVASGVAGMMDKGSSGASEKIAGELVGKIGNIGMAGIGSMVTKVLGGGALIGGILGATGGGAVTKGLLFGTKSASNPYMEMVFTGITFRDFSFDFNFMPVSATEVSDVIEIIKMFRLHSKPSYVGEGAGITGKAFFNYPMYFDIEFLTLASNAGKFAGGTDAEGRAARGRGVGEEYYATNKYLPKIKRCVCTSVVTDFAAATMWAAFESGKPVNTKMTLSFKEIELVMAEDVYNPSRGEF
jgi:hypothetical protein